MTLTKNQQTLAIVVVLAVVAYWLFFRKKPESSYQKIVLENRNVAGDRSDGEILGNKTTF